MCNKAVDCVAVEFINLGGGKPDSTGKTGPGSAEPRAPSVHGIWTDAHSALVSCDCSGFQNSREKEKVLFDCVCFSLFCSFFFSFFFLLSNICY